MKKIMGKFRVCLIGLIFCGIISTFVILASIGASMNAQSYQSGRSYLEERGFTFDEAQGWEIYGSWVLPKTVWLHYSEFVAKAREVGVSTIYIEYTENKYDYNFWFFHDGVKYIVFEKFYVPKGD